MSSRRATENSSWGRISDAPRRWVVEGASADGWAVAPLDFRPSSGVALACFVVPVDASSGSLETLRRRDYVYVNRLLRGGRMRPARPRSPSAAAIRAQHHLRVEPEEKQHEESGCVDVRDLGWGLRGSGLVCALLE